MPWLKCLINSLKLFYFYFFSFKKVVLGGNPDNVFQFFFNIFKFDRRYGNFAKAKALFRFYDHRVTLFEYKSIASEIIYFSCCFKFNTSNFDYPEGYRDCHLLPTSNFGLPTSNALFPFSFSLSTQCFVTIFANAKMRAKTRKLGN